MSRLSLFLLFSLIVACQSSKEDVLDAPLLRYWAMQACSTPLDIDYEMTPDQWSEKVVTYLQSEGFQVEDSVIGFEEIVYDDPICGNCLRTGDYIDVLVPEDQREALEALGFEGE